MRFFGLAVVFLLLGAGRGWGQPILCVSTARTVAPGSSRSKKESALNGLVTDPTGALVPGAAVHVVSINGTLVRSLTADSNGKFALQLPPGAYSLSVSMPGFSAFSQLLHIGGTPINLQVKLNLLTTTQVVTVNAYTNRLSTAEDANKSALDLKGSALSTLSDDDTTFQQQVLAMAGGAGPNPPQIYVDGFADGTFPPKSDILEIKINQNPFSAAYESLGFGRIEIITKPGTGRLHGSISVYGDPSQLNSRNPYLYGVNEPGYYRLHTVGNIGGPLGKNSTYFLSANYYNQQSNAIIDAQDVNSAGAIYGISEAVPDPTETQNYTARFDRQWTPTNTFTGRYEFDHTTQTNGGLSQFVLPSQAWNSTADTNTLQLSNIHIASANSELDTRFMWSNTRDIQNPESNAPSISVSGTVNAGGSPSQVSRNVTNFFSFQENGAWTHGPHFIRAGVRYHLHLESETSTAGFNGSFTFPAIQSYQIMQQGLNNGESWPTIQATCEQVQESGQSGSEKVCGGPSQFQITSGKSAFSVMTGNVALWAEDEWKLNKSLTTDLGFRFESQSAIPDHADPAPHFALAWSLGAKNGKPAPVVLRFGSAMFYDRFQIGNLLTAVRQGNPTVQQTYTVEDPQFFTGDIPPLSQLSAATAPTIYRVAPNLRSEYDIDSGAGAEFSLGVHGSIAVNYLNFVRDHQWVSINANAPLPDGTRPFGAAAGNIYEYTSEGDGRGYAIFTHPQIHFTPHWGAWAFAQIIRNNSDTDGAGNFASNSYDVHQDYGRSPWDRNQQLYMGTYADDLKWGLGGSLFLAAIGGQPFNITTGADNNGDTIYNDRPSFASAASNPADVIDTRYGNFDLDPQPGEQVIPFDYGRSAGPVVSLQAQVSETLRFGPILPPEGVAMPGHPAPVPEPRYALVFSLEGQNVTNTNSPAPPIGVLTSPFFGQSISTGNNFLVTTAANRTFTLRTEFRF